MRSLRRRLGRHLDFQIEAAEAVLAAMAVVLLVWLLWPEERGPRLVDSANDRQLVDTSERALVELKPAQTTATVLEDIREHSNSVRNGEALPSATPERRRIARPSELADRLQTRTAQPTRRKPQDSVDGTPVSDSIVNAVRDTIGDEAVGTQPSPAPIPPETVQATLSSMINGLKDGEVAPDAPTVQTYGSDEDDLDLPVVSSERLETEPLADIDLSDLDTLVPVSEETKLAAVDPAISIPVEPSQSEETVAEPFIIERDPDISDNEVKIRPRDDAPTWLRNAVAYADERPIIAIVLDDLGLKRRNTAALNDLPAPLTLSFLPYAGRIEAQTKAAQNAGHELMLHLPMEPLGSNQPGPDALTTNINQAEFTARLLKNLDRFEGFVGVNNHMGSKLTADSSRMDVVMQELRKRDVLFLDSKTSARSVADEIAGEHGVPNTTRDIFFDNEIDVEAIKRQLSRAEQVARLSGSAVAIGHPHDATIEALREWLPTLEARGFALAPISAVVARRACSSGVLIADETCGRYLQVRKTTRPAIAATDS